MDRNAVSVALSLAWPGSVVAARQKRILCFYSGTGVEQLLTTYQPPLPPAFCAEYSLNVDKVDPVFIGVCELACEPLSYPRFMDPLRRWWSRATPCPQRAS